MRIQDNRILGYNPTIRKMDIIAYKDDENKIMTVNGNINKQNYNRLESLSKQLKYKLI